MLEHLPEVLRTPVMYTFCMTFTYPVRTLYNEFVQWKEKIRIKAGGSPQVCMLQKSVKDSLGIDIVIEEYDGKPYDFVVKTKSVNMDKDRQLAALLDRYKLAGKSYKYENGAVKWNAEWGEFVEEICVTTGTWGGFVNVKFDPVIPPGPEVNRVTFYVAHDLFMIKADRNVESNITIIYAIDCVYQTNWTEEGIIGSSTLHSGILKSRVTLTKGKIEMESSHIFAAPAYIKAINKVNASIEKSSEEDKTIYRLETTWKS